MKGKRVYIEVTNICNLNCSFCPKTKRKPEYMDVSFFEKVASQVKEYTDQIYLHVMGEPLLHPKIKEILGICEEFKLQVNLTTNGTLLAQHIEWLKNSTALRKLTLSIQAYEANDIGWKETLAQVVNCVNQLPTRVIVEYRLWNWGVSTCAREQVAYLTACYGQPTKNTDKLSSNKYENSIKLKNNVYIMFDKPFLWPNQSKQDASKRYCPALTRQIAILVDGRVVPCCLDSEGKMTLGNLHLKSFDEIVKSARVNEMMCALQKGERKFELCKTCQFGGVR